MSRKKKEEEEKEAGKEKKKKKRRRKEGYEGKRKQARLFFFKIPKCIGPYLIFFLVIWSSENEE